MRRPLRDARLRHLLASACIFTLMFAAALAAEDRAVCAVRGPREGTGFEPVKATATYAKNDSRGFAVIGVTVDDRAPLVEGPTTRAKVAYHARRKNVPHGKRRLSRPIRLRP